MVCGRRLVYNTDFGFDFGLAMTEQALSSTRVAPPRRGMPGAGRLGYRG
jgi:hypothetical protein